VLDKRTTSVLFTVFVFVAVPVIAYQARRPLVIVIFSLFFAYLLEPLVAWFERRFHGSRTMGIAATYLSLAIAISVLLVAAGPRIIRQSSRLIRELPTLMDNIGSGYIAQQIGDRQLWSNETQMAVQGFLSDHRSAIQGYVQAGVTRIPGFAGTLLWLLLIPLLAVFILKGKAQFASALSSLVENRHDRRFLSDVLSDMDSMLASFIRAQLSLCGLSALAYTLFLLLARFPFSFPIAAIAGVLEFIPMLGAVASASLIMGMAIVTGYKHWLLILLFLLVWRGLQDYLNSPLLMGRGLQLHPFAVVLGVLVFGELAGVPGVFLSVPIMASLRILWKNWKRRGKAIETDISETKVARLAHLS
jgi:predicted PurR-regulated permease PerM